MDELNKPVGGIQSIDYLAQILELFCDQRARLSLKEIAQLLNESPAKIFRYLVSLTRIGLLSKTEDNEYEIGNLALDLSFTALNQLDPIEEACRIAKKIQQETHYAVAISVWGSMGPTVIKTYEPLTSLYSKIRVGSVMSLCSTSIGRTFAKYLPEHVLRENLEFEYLRHSGQKLSAKEKQEFMSCIQAHQSERLTFMLDRPIAGLSSISVPIFSISEEIQFVITVFNHSEILQAERTTFEHYLQDQVLNLSKSIGLK